MKRKISAIVYTFVFMLETFIMPFFIEWYSSKLKSTPIAVYAILFCFVVAQMALCFHLWARVFDKNLD